MKKQVTSAVMFGLIGIAAIILGYSTGKEGKATLSWLPVNGVVLSSDISSKRVRKTTGNKGYKTEKRFNISYEYEVKGKKYTSYKLGWGKKDGKTLTYEQLLATYPKGKTVKVFYNPKAPGKAVLHPGTGAGPMVLNIIGTLFLCVSGIYVIVIIKKQRA